MCQVIRVAALQHEAFELFEEQSFDQLVSQRFATEIERAWELEAEDYESFE